MHHNTLEVPIFIHRKPKISCTFCELSTVYNKTPFCDRLNHFIHHYWACDLQFSTMATKIKGIYKSFKYITQIFVVKEREMEMEMEIGYPTDVKHVAHIGWDGPSGIGPSWMNDFETATDFSTSLGNLGGVRDPNPMAMSTSWSSQDFEESTGSQPTPNTYKGIPSSGAPHVPKKPKRKKVKATSSSESLSASSSQSSRKVKTMARYSERGATPIAQA